MNNGADEPEPAGEPDHGKDRECACGPDEECECTCKPKEAAPKQDDGDGNTAATSSWERALDAINSGRVKT